MTQAHSTCRQCGENATLGALEELSGAAGTVELTIHRMPARICPQDHRHLPSPEFAARLMDYLGDAEHVGIPAAHRRGWFRKRSYCTGCQCELDATAAKVSTITIGVRLQDLAPFDVDLRLPVCACPHCGLEQTPDGKLYVDQVPVALVQAFKSAQVAPD